MDATLDGKAADDSTPDCISEPFVGTVAEAAEHPVFVVSIGLREKNGIGTH